MSVDSSLYRDPSTLRRAGEKEARSNREREGGRMGEREGEREREGKRESVRARAQASEHASMRERVEAKRQDRPTQTSVYGDFHTVSRPRALTFENLRTGRNSQKSVSRSFRKYSSVYLRRRCLAQKFLTQVEIDEIHREVFGLERRGGRGDIARRKAGPHVAQPRGHLSIFSMHWNSAARGRDQLMRQQRGGARVCICIDIHIHMHIPYPSPHPSTSSPP